MERSKGNEDIQIPVSPVMPLAYNPADLIKNLEREAQALKLLHAKISDQLQRLRIEESLLRTQYETAQTSSLVRDANSLPPELSFINEISIQQFEHDFNQVLSSAIQSNESINNSSIIINLDEDEEDEDDEDIDYDEKTQETMRELLENELGKDYMKDHGVVDSELSDED